MNPASIAAEIQPLIDRVNLLNQSNLVLTVADNEVLVEEFDVPLVIIENVRTGQDAYDAVIRSLPLWNLIF